MNRQTEAVQASINRGHGDPATLKATLGLHCEGVDDPNIESPIELNLLPKRVGGGLRFRMRTIPGLHSFTHGKNVIKGLFRRLDWQTAWLSPRSAEDEAEANMQECLGGRICDPYGHRSDRCMGEPATSRNAFLEGSQCHA
jgi:hypothetical protein